MPLQGQSDGRGPRASLLVDQCLSKGIVDPGQRPREPNYYWCLVFLLLACFFNFCTA
jgi:hypothetical protein